mgnify:CR=1 FL=1
MQNFGGTNKEYYGIFLYWLIAKPRKLMVISLPMFPRFRTCNSQSGCSFYNNLANFRRNIGIFIDNGKSAMLEVCSYKDKLKYSASS